MQPLRNVFYIQKNSSSQREHTGEKTMEGVLGRGSNIAKRSYMHT